MPWVNLTEEVEGMFSILDVPHFGLSAEEENGGWFGFSQDNRLNLNKATTHDRGPSKDRSLDRHVARRSTRPPAGHRGRPVGSGPNKSNLKAKALALLASGTATRNIAVELGVARTTVLKWSKAARPRAFTSSAVAPSPAISLRAGCRWFEARANDESTQLVRP